MENKGTTNIFQLTPLVSTRRAKARCLPFMDHLLQDMNTRMLVAQVRSVHHTETTGASDTKKNSPAIGSVSGDLHQLQQEVGRWKARWELMNATERLDTFDSTIQVFNPNLYTPTCTLQSSVSTATTVRCHRNAASYSGFCLGVILLCFQKCTTFQLIGCHSCYTTFWSTRPS